MLVLRYRRPELERPFRTPFVPVVPALGILVCGALMVGLGLATWLRLVVWMALGLLVYFGYGHRHSRLARAEATAGGPSVRNGDDGPSTR